MVSIGRTDLVRTKPLREKKSKVSEKKQQEIGCSDEIVDSIHDHSELNTKNYNVQSIPKEINIASPALPEANDPRSIPDVLKESSNIGPDRQSTGEQEKVKSNKTVNSVSEKKESKNFISSIKSFFSR